MDVFSVDGSSCDVVTHDADVFYDSELLAIAHRYASTSNELASTRLCVWYGKKSFLEKERNAKYRNLPSGMIQSR